MNAEDVQTTDKLPIDTPNDPNSNWSERRAAIKPLHLGIVILIVVAGDYLIFQSAGGFTGWAVWGLLTAILLLVGIGRGALKNRFAWLMIGLLGLTTWRLVWQGDSFIACIAVVQLTWWIMFLHQVPLEWWRFAYFVVTWVPSGLFSVPHAFSLNHSTSARKTWRRTLEIGIPLLVTVIFAGIFVNANPDAFNVVWNVGTDVVRNIIQWLYQFSSWEILLWILLSLLSLGALFPSVYAQAIAHLLPPVLEVAPRNKNSDIRPAFEQIGLNTLVMLAILFGVYLTIDFTTMWFRKFPEGFHYSGYAHAGAAWLTFALALATIVLSIIFQGRWREWSGAGRLYFFAKLWTCENLVLALCAINRLWIYVQFNGMTTLRVVGYLGIVCVSIGLVLVLCKIAYDWSIMKLINAQIWIVAIAILLGATLPVDRMIYSYNTSKILNGSYAPSVQMHVQFISNSGYLSLIPLVDSEQLEIREGSKAMLAEKLISLETESEERLKSWRSYQAVDTTLLRKLKGMEKDVLSTYLESDLSRTAAIERFRQFAMQWY